MEEAGTLRAVLKFGAALEDAGLPYMIVGAHAVMAHGQPRATNDLDFVVHLPIRDRGRAQETLEAHGCAEFEVRRDEFGERLACTTPDGPALDVFFTPPNPAYDREFERRVAISVGSRPIWFVSREDLVLRKRVNVRLRRGLDFDDAVAVLAVQGASFDAACVRSHCGRYRACELFERALKEVRSLAKGP